MAWITLQNKTFDLKDIRKIQIATVKDTPMIILDFYSENSPECLLYTTYERAEEAYLDLMMHLPRLP